MKTDKELKLDLSSLLCCIDGKITAYRMTHKEQEVDNSEIIELQEQIVTLWKTLNPLE